jgi:dynein heavy chain
MMKLLENAFIDKKVLKPLEWVPKWQGQLLIASGSLAYTKRCERALFAIKSGRDKNALRVVKKKYTSFLRRLTEMVRSEDIDATNRCKVVALITTEIHNRDVIEKMLRFSCQDQSDFIWSSQLRFYLNEGFCEIHQSNYSLKFGYEYQGNNGRLVITPLTDRCVLTLLTALSLHRGGNPLGPAGTGKTETVRIHFF